MENIKNCKDCQKEFTPIIVFGQETVRCEDCKKRKGTKYVKPLRHNYTSEYADCTDPRGHQLNPGGYCIYCHYGRDFS